jgi:RES domain-containing protein
VRTAERGGSYVRVADPDWDDPLDGGYAERAGGRWNAPGSFPVVYLCATVAVARALVLGRLEGQPFGPEDLYPDSAPVLADAAVPRDRYVDAVTARGCRSAGLPATYPLDSRGRRVGWSRCRPIGQRAWEDGYPGIACRSAAPEAPQGGEELAFFARRRKLRAGRTRRFDDWFW